MQEKVEILESVGQMVLAAQRTAVGSGLTGSPSRPLPSTRRRVQMRSRGCTKMIWQGESLDVVRFRGIDHCKIGGEAGLCDDVEGIGKHPYAASRCKSAGRPFNFVPFLIGIVEAATGCPALLRLIRQRGAAGRRHRHPAAVWHGEAKRRTAKNSARRVGMLIARKGAGRSDTV